MDIPETTPEPATRIPDLRGIPLGAKSTRESAALLRRLLHGPATAVPVAAFQSSI